MQSTGSVPLDPTVTLPQKASLQMRLAALAPHALALAIQFAAPSFFDPMFDEPPSIVGLPLGAVVGVVILAWATFGAWLVWATSSRTVAAIAVAAFTLPSIFALIVAPAVIRVLQNLP